MGTDLILIQLTLTIHLKCWFKPDLFLSIELFYRCRSRLSVEILPIGTTVAKMCYTSIVV